MTNTARTSLVEAFNKATHLMSMESREGDERHYFLQSAEIRTWPAASFNDYTALFTAVIRLGSLGGESFKKPQLLREYGSPEQATVCIVRLLRAAAVLLSLEQSETVKAAINAAETASL